jgi:hypothetical protein
MATLQTAVEFSEAQRSRVLAHLQELLDSPAFAGSRRRQAFLRYVVEETLAGRGEAIKETNIAVDVFQRSSDFDTQSASIVRVTGGEVRKRLAQVYASGPERDIRIELPLGSYHPLIQVLPPIVEPEGPTILEFKAKPKSDRRWAGWFAGAAAVLGIAAISSLDWKPKPSNDPIWRPYVHRDQPVLISLMTPTLMVVRDAQKWLATKGSIPASELTEMESVFVGVGGALGGALFAEQLTSRDQPFVLKFGNDLSFADLKNSPAILIGASRWTRELTQKLRFRMVSEEPNKLVIHDREQPDRIWAISPGRRTDRAEGYSLITRLLHSESGRPVLLVEGIDARNTQAAVEFLARPGTFAQFAESAPAGWETKNFQVVLNSTIHGNSSGSVKIAASRIW